MVNQNNYLRGLLFLFFSISLLFSFFMGENSAGGAKYDYTFISEYILLFSNNIKENLIIYDPKLNPHLPFYYIIFGKLYNLFNLEILRFFYLLVSLTLPILFYKILKLNFKSVNKNILFIISLLIFLSPYFRSSAIWLTNDNLTLILLSISIYYFLKTDKFKSKNISYMLKCFFYLMLCVYVRQNFVLFIFFYIYFLFKNTELKLIFHILIFNFILAIPILYYLFFNGHIYYYFSTNSAYKINYSLNLMICLNIILFYLIPFVIPKPIIRNLILKLKFNLKQVSVLIFFVFLINYFVLDFSTPIDGVGGGVFYKLIIKSINIPLLFVFFAAITLALLFCILEKKVSNIILIILLFLLYPLPTLYQKYYDPLLIIVLFSLFSIDKKIILNFFDKRYVLFPVIYFSSFLFFAIYYYS